MASEDDLLGLMGITPSSFRVVLDPDIGAVVVEVRVSENPPMRWCMTPHAAETLEMALHQTLLKLRREDG